jgi:S1-C subfamily serine protease
VSESCIHCHQIGDARRDYYWSLPQSIPEDILFPYPHPKSIGMILDPKERSKIKRVIADSPAESVGLRAGDEVLKMNGQPMLSMADVQWVLHHIPAEGGSVNLTLQRGDERKEIVLGLHKGWRRNDDTSWRVGSWGMRRIATGGMRLLPLSQNERQELGITSDMALRAANVNFGKLSPAKRAGFLKGDVLIEYDGRNDFSRESDVFVHANQHHRPGETVGVKVLREGHTLSLELPIQQ